MLAEHAHTLIISRTVEPVPVPRLMGTQPKLGVLNSLSRAATWPSARSITWM